MSYYRVQAKLELGSPHSRYFVLFYFSVDHPIWSPSLFFTTAAPPPSQRGTLFAPAVSGFPPLPSPLPAKGLSSLRAHRCYPSARYRAATWQGSASCVGRTWTRSASERGGGSRHSPPPSNCLRPPPFVHRRHLRSALQVDVFVSVVVISQVDFVFYIGVGQRLLVAGLPLPLCSAH